MRTHLLFLSVLAMMYGKAVFAETSKNRIQVHFREIHYSGLVEVIGNFGLPVGQFLTLEGKRARASKTTNLQTFDVEKVNGHLVKSAGGGRWPSVIQIRNVNELPNTTQIGVKGFEVLHWIGAPEKNWHLETYFVVTEVLYPKSMQIVEWNW